MHEYIESKIMLKNILIYEGFYFFNLRLTKIKDKCKERNEYVAKIYVCKLYVIPFSLKKADNST